MRLHHSPLNLIVCIAISLLAYPWFARAGDTIRVKTITFNDITKRSGTWMFPPPQQYEKVLLEYTLKCDPRTTQDQYPCGEWDYLTYIVLTDSTGQFDSTPVSQVNYVVRGTTPATFGYTTTPTPRKRRYRTTTVSGTTEYEWLSIGSQDQANAAILRPQGSRARFMITAAELTAAGLTAGPLSAIRLIALDSSGPARLFTVRLGNSTTTSLRPPLREEGLTTVVRRDVTFDDGEVNIPFDKAFSWDGASNLIVEFSCLSIPTSVRLASGATPVQGLIDDASRRALYFTEGDLVEVPADIGSSINDQVTICFWAYGDVVSLPKNHSVFEAYDANGQRVLNAHLPWSDRNVYWDAGAAPGASPDRIYKSAIETDFEGSWRHWAFVKNATTGEMKVYLDGELFVEGTGKKQSMKGISRFLIGRGGSGSFAGLLDEIQVWNVALDQATIRSWMSRKTDALHPNYANLQAYYNCENILADGRLRDISDYGRHATMHGLPVHEILMLEQLGYLTLTNTARPTMAFHSGAVFVSTAREDVDVSLSERQTSLVRYNRPVQSRIYRPTDSDYPGTASDTIVVYEAGWLPIIDEVGLQVDSVQVTPTVTLQRDVKTFYDPVVEFELGRFITPYGIGLDLGPNGFKWIFDVTDFAPLLRNNVTLSAGNQQELLDMTFVMIKGLPAREVKQIDQLWYDRSAHFPSVLNNTSLSPVTVTLHPQAQSFKLRAVTSGHDFSNPTNCAEFCPRDHFFAIDGQERFTWKLWKECGDNPVYPQGGTWLVDRTGWCPGAPVDLYEYDITRHVAGESSVTIDYGIKPDTTSENWGRWEVAAHLIGYGPATHQVDAEMVDIIAPNNWEYYSRLNPICGQPVIVIRNRGSKPLTKLTIAMSSDGGDEQTYEWTGNLSFMESDTVALPVPQWPTTNGLHTFTVQLTTPEADQYESNNSMSTQYSLTNVYYPQLEIALRTNKYAEEQYEWELRKIGGETIKRGSNLPSETLLVDTFNLDYGCYEYRLTNKLGYGLDFWFLRNQLGSGSLEFRSNGNLIRSFNPDFGNTAWVQFSVAPKPTISTSADTVWFVTATPQPVQQTFSITAVGDAPLRIDSLNISQIRAAFSITSVSATLPRTIVKGDSIHVTVTYSRDDVGTNSGTARVYSNDERNPIKLIRLQGSVGATSVESTQYQARQLEIAVAPYPAVTGSVARLLLANNTESPVIVMIADMLGQVVHSVRYEAVSDELQFNVPDIASGLYYVTVQTKHALAFTPLQITR